MRQAGMRPATGAMGVIGVWAALAAAPVWAHGFGQRFTLPLPFWLYATGACAALLVSFAGLTLIRPRAMTPPQPVPAGSPLLSSTYPTLADPGPAARVWMVVQTGLLALAVVAAVWGSAVATANFAMTWFWIWVVLVSFYAASVAGPHYRLLNPWWCAAFLWQGRRGPRGQRPPFPQRLSGWPAFVMFMLLIGVELFGRGLPSNLALLLAIYTAVSFIGCRVWGRAAWFVHGDLLDAMFRYMAMLGDALRSIRTGASATPLLAAPVATGHQALIVAMLAATAFDALRESVPWASVLWSVLLDLFPQNTQNPLAVLAALSDRYRQAEMLGWLLMPGLYVAAMALAVWTSRQVAPTGLAWRDDLGLAALALLPLVLGYHLAHYFTLVFSELPNLLHLLSDPLGKGWNLFGTANRYRAPWVLDMETVWHWQVGFIVAGHVGGVLVSHGQAAQWHSHRAALVRSQLPNLVWMLGLTTWGLWTLSQPLKAG